MSRSRSRSRGRRNRYSRSRSRDRRRTRSRSRGRREKPKSYSDHLFSVRISDLPRDIRYDDLRPKFEKFGRIGDLFMPRDRDTKEFRGFGFVRYHDKRDMEDCLYEYERRGPRILGKEICVQLAPERPFAPGKSGEQEKRFSSFPGHKRRSRSRSRSRDRRRSRSRSSSSESSRSRSRSRSRTRSRR